MWWMTACLAVAGCSVDPLRDGDLSCPCADGFVCVGDRCIVDDDPRPEDAARRDTGLPPVIDAAIGIDSGVAPMDVGPVLVDTGTDAASIDSGPIDTGAPTFDVGVANDVLQHYAPSACASLGIVGPPPEYVQAYYGAWTPPASRPFLATAVAIDVYGGELNGNDRCRTAFPTEMIVFAGSGRPPESPTIIFRAPIPAAAEAQVRTVRMSLTTPHRLAAGDKLFVAVQIASQGALTTCVLGCLQSSPPPQINYRSSTRMPPFQWVDLGVSSSGQTTAIPILLGVRAFGRIE